MSLTLKWGFLGYPVLRHPRASLAVGLVVVAAACSSTDDTAPGGDTDTGGSDSGAGGQASDGGSSGTGATGSGATGSGATGGSSDGGTAGADGDGLGGLGGIGGAGSDGCYEPDAGVVTGAQFDGSASGTSGAGQTVSDVSGGVRIADADGLADPDNDPLTFANNPWVSAWATFYPDRCADLSGFASVSLTITTTTELHLVIALTTLGTTPAVEGGTCNLACSNHYAEDHLVDGTEVITLTLPLTERMWSDPAADPVPFAQDEIQSLLVMLSPEDSSVSASLPPYDLTVTNVTLNE